MDNFSSYKKRDYYTYTIESEKETYFVSYKHDYTYTAYGYTFSYGKKDKKSLNKKQ